jgi:hypothetical protein
MKVLKHILFLSLTLIISTSSFGQDVKSNEQKPSLNNGTIESQFDYLYRKSSSYQEYKVVKKTFYQKIKGNVLDSLKSLKSELSDSKNLIGLQGKEINSLKSDLKTTNNNLTDVTKEKDNIKFLGIAMTKASYNSLLWTIIVGLVVLLVIFIFKFKSSNSITIQSNNLLADTEAEFDAFKATSLEREQKVRRELQDELNKKKYGNKKGKKE